MSRWKTVDQNKELPESAGVYAIYFCGTLEYIGSTSNIRARLDQHASNGVIQKLLRESDAGGSPIWAKVRLSKSFGEYAMAELRLLHRIRPRMNKQFRLAGGAAHGR